MPTKLQRLIDRGVEYVFGRVTLLLRRKVRKRDRKIVLLKEQLKQSQETSKILRETNERLSKRLYHAQRAIDGSY